MAKKIFKIADAIASLCDYAQTAFKLSKLDALYCENLLLDLFNETERGSKVFFDDLSLQHDIIDPIVNYAISQKMCAACDAVRFETKILGMVMPTPSEVVAKFDSKAASHGIEAATNYLNAISVRSNYIRMVDIEKNIKWNVESERGNIGVTINLSKPEKSNKQVYLDLMKPKANYPLCPICLENLGYGGNSNQAARQTLRVIPIQLADEDWYFQFSPYVYFDHHGIVFSAEHKPMKIRSLTFKRQLDFVEMFPHYFIGSNADLPIVGGSILSHDHFQCGKKVLPMFERPVRKTYRQAFYENLTIGVLDWYNSVIVLQSTDRRAVENAASIIHGSWSEYSDHTLNIIARSDKDRHNTITPIALFDRGLYTIYLILRNNRTDNKHPHGIFHPTEDMHNIKSEGIGLIEAMGLFILPGRLFTEIKIIEDILTGQKPLDFKEITIDPQISKHMTMIAQLTNDYGTAMDPFDASNVVVNYINSTCAKILDCTAVFKNTQEGYTGFDRFLATLKIV
ncbi:MAG: UDP-glucose--hexose-1-phosphate uridylyltransferase [Christensenellaceae bacterium]|jgi:UDPglucose--hexose-1-phosphate uridylyltransferase|nr:UDP-glucose--hexose-1-phosphate uridylyltransferase [Christensenellaceae bacterium]